MLRLILGAAGSGKTSVITSEIAEKIAAGERGICMIVPEQYSFEAERQLAAACGDALSLGAEVLSFSRLAVRVAQEMGTGGRTYLDSGGRLLCLCLALNRIAPRLSLFSGAGRSPRLQLEILKSIDELKNACVSPEALLQAAESLEAGELKSKLNDLSLCFEAYDAVLAQGRADPADRLLRLAETLGGSALARQGQVYIDGFTDFTGAETLVIEALISAGVPLTVCLTCDELFSEGEHFQNARIAANALLRCAEKLGVETNVFLSEADGGKAPALRFFDEHLFKHSSEAFDGDISPVKLLCSADIRSECEAAAARCLELVRETGCRWRDIAIAARGFDGYAALLGDVFSLYGVPLFAAQRGSISQKPIPALIASAFDVISGGWDLTDVMAYIKTGLTGMPLVDCDRLEGYATLWGISGSTWLKKAPWKQHPSGYGAAKTEDSARLLDEIDQLRRTLARPLARLAESGKKSETAISQARALTDFLLDISLPETLEKHVLDLEEAGRAQLADEYSQLWGVLCRALEQFAALLGDTPMTQEEFSEFFLTMLSQYEIASIPLSPDAVTAGELDRMRRRNIKHLIILGASDDRIPGAISPSGLISEDDRTVLEELGLLRQGASDPLSREFSLIYNCVSLPSESLTVSYCQTDSEGAKARPSFLIARARLLFGTEINHADTDASRLSASGPAFLLASLFGAGGGGASRLAYEYFASDHAGRERLEALRARAEAGRGEISHETVEGLYGSVPRVSPSRVNAFFSCKLFYFLRYGLRLNEREKAGFDPPELGTYMHYVLEGCASEISATVGFKNVTPGLAERLADKYTDLYISEALGGFEDKSPRFVFLFNRLRPSVKRVVADMIRELSRSDFAPLRFELSFGAGGEAPPIHLSDGENRLTVTGVADRVDGCFKDGRLYLRVVDYKTGKKSFSLSDIWYGMGMQMLLYLFSLEQGGKELFGAEIVPAGVLYVPARDAVVSSARDLTDEELAGEKAKALRRSGLLINDRAVLEAMEHGDTPEYLPVKYKDGEVSTSDSLADEGQFAALKKHVDTRLLELSRELSGGKIDAEPCYRSESDNACMFCPYTRVCRFDERRDRRRYMGKLPAKEFWKQIGGATHE